MYVEDHLWIADKLKVELPTEYLVATNNYPFLDHSDTAKLEIWDHGKTIISTTKLLRETDKWPVNWVCVGKKEKDHYALDCSNGRVMLIRSGSVEILHTWLGVKPIMDQIYDGYRGKLPPGMPRKDSSFKHINYREDLPWRQNYDEAEAHPLIDDQVMRINENYIGDLIELLQEKKVNIFRINGGNISNRDAFYDAISMGITGVEGCIDEWNDISRMLARQVIPVAKGGFMDAAIIWEHADETMRYHPNLMAEFMIYIQTDWMYFLEDTGCCVQDLYAGKPENGYIITLENK